MHAADGVTLLPGSPEPCMAFCAAQLVLWVPPVQVPALCGPRSRAMTALNAGKTMFDKIWESHLVDDASEGSLIYVDRHLVHEVTSPQAFEGLRTAGRRVRRPDCTLVTVDHNVPTTDRSTFTSVESFIREAESRTQVMALEENVRDFNLTYFAMDDKRQGIVHIIGPEQVGI